MFRVNLLGKVGYFKNKNEAFEFAKERFQKYDFDIILNDLRCSVEDAQKDFLNLRAFNTKYLIGQNKMIYKNNLGIKMANYFSLFRYKLDIKERYSIKYCLKNEKCFKKIFGKVLKVERHIDMSLGSFFSASRLFLSGDVPGNFSPAIAKAIYELYSPKKNAKILDFCAGFGGRLVGAMSSKYNYTYVGVDPSTEACKGLNKLIDFLNVKNRAKIIQMPFEDSENMLKEKFDLCFTSPPYFKKEIYSFEDTQSWKRYPEIELWKEKFLKKSFEIVMKKIKTGCYMIINIANVNIKGKFYDLENLTLQTAKEVGFKYKGFREIELTKKPGFKKKYKTEKIFVFEK